MPDGRPGKALGETTGWGRERTESYDRGSRARRGAFSDPLTARDTQGRPPTRARPRPPSGLTVTCSSNMPTGVAMEQARATTCPDADCGAHMTGDRAVTLCCPPGFPQKEPPPSVTPHASTDLQGSEPQTSCTQRGHAHSAHTHPMLYTHDTHTHSTQTWVSSSTPHHSLMKAAQVLSGPACLSGSSMSCNYLQGRPPPSPLCSP